MPDIRPALTSILVLFPGLLFASTSAETQHIDLTNHWVGFTAIAIFISAYLLVMGEEFTHLRKSKPVMLAAGIIWALVAWFYTQNGMPHAAEQAARHNLLEYAELMLFLLVAMTYINAMEERNAFEALRSWLIQKGYSFKQLFWITGLLAFVISPIADNLTTALLMCAVVMAVAGDNSKFILLACINIVVAANAGGAFSPFGDITTLMVWQKNIATTQGHVDFASFFNLFIPSLVNWLIPASIMALTIPNKKPAGGGEAVPMKRGAKRIISLFLLTIATAVSFHNLLNLPPVMGMLTGLAYLQLFGYFLKKTHNGAAEGSALQISNRDNMAGFDVFRKVARAEWDTLLFFYGVVLCVGGLGFIGYLSLASEIMYIDWGPTNANIAVGVLSAIVDNIPVMFAVLSMMPDMSTGQWLLVTLTAGVGGSMLVGRLGRRSGINGTGQRQIHLLRPLEMDARHKALGYAASIATHLWINSHLF